MPASSTAQETQQEVTQDQHEAEAKQATEQDGNTAESSTADDVAASNEAAEGVKPKSMLEAVKAAIEPVKTEEGDEQEAGKSPDPKGEVKEGDKQATDKDAEEPPFHKHPRWQEMLKQRRDLEAQVKSLEPEVQNFRQFREAVRSANLQAAEVDEGFEIMRLMKSDPVKAYEKLRVHMDALEAFMGNRLPEDLQQKVEAGTVDEEVARELARTRNMRAHEQTRLEEQERRRQEETQRSEQGRVRQFLNNCGEAVTKWEREWESSDPDYARKQPLVDAQLVKLNMELGMPKSVEDAVDRVKKARDTVEQTLAPVLRKTTEKRVVTGGSSAAQAAPRPKTLKEAIALAAKGQK